MKIHVFLDIQDGPWGGGNQFLKALRAIWRKNGRYAESMEEADSVLVNSHHFESVENLEKLFSALRENPAMTVIHRIDGPVTFIRKSNDGTDDLIFEFNQLFADASILQSQWSVEKTGELGYDIKEPVSVIYNAPDPETFFPAKRKNGSDDKPRLIATSWSSNIRKGFDVYQWMDENLDWNRFDMTFVGNSDITFKNICHIPPVKSTELAELLRSHDIFVTASKADPCSNSLIEALHCGLPALVYDDGGHSELVGEGGEAFQNTREIPALLDKMAGQESSYAAKIKLPDISEVAAQYYEFISSVEVTDSGKEGNFDNFVKKYAAYLRRHNPGTVIKMMKKLRASLLRSG